MSNSSRRYRKPDLMFLVAFSVGMGVLVTSVVQAAQPITTASLSQPGSRQQSLPERWLYALWDLDLADKLKSWKPKIDTVRCDDGVSLLRPFGNRGPVLQISTSVPEHAEYSLRAGGDTRVGALGGDVPDAYLFLQKRW